jgi:hypothetical protein
VRRPFEEPHTDPEPLQLVDDQHLVGVDAREPVGAQADHTIKRAGLGSVTQAVQRRAVQPRAGVPVIDELLDHLITARAGRGAQRLELGADRATLLLTLGRHPGVERDLHSPTTLNRRA